MQVSIAPRNRKQLYIHVHVGLVHYLIIFILTLLFINIIITVGEIYINI